MNTKFPLHSLYSPSSSSSSSSSSQSHSHSPLHLISTTTFPFLRLSLPPSSAAFRAHSAATTSLTPSYPTNNNNDVNKNPEDEHLLILLRNRQTEQAWLFYSNSPHHLPSSTCLSRLVSQLSYKNTQESFSRAQSIVTRLRHVGQLHRLDSNSLGLLAVSAVKMGHTHYAISIIKSMLRSDYLPHVKAWSAVVSRLAGAPDDGPFEAIRVFDMVVKQVRKVEDQTLMGNSKPDTAAFNGVLNACANIGDLNKFCQLFDEMPQWDVLPDALTYNVMIKLFARVGRKDLLVGVLEVMLHRKVEPCVTTLHSLVAAYVGFGDLRTAEYLVQALREGRKDVCSVLRDVCNEGERESKEENDLFEKLLPSAIRDRFDNPPLLPKTYSPNTRIYTTLMKGYMKAGRVSDTVRMLEAMRCQKDSDSHPNHVSYTTVISALVKSGSMEKARQVLAEMTRIGVPANRITYNILLKGYCQQLQIDKAKELIREMANNAEISPDVVSYNTLIDGCISVDDSAGALEYFNEMRAKGIAPSKISYTTLMKAFAMSGQPKLANRVFDEMLKDRRVKIDLIAWNMLVEGYCKMGLIEEAKKVVEKMKEHGFDPNVVTYGSLANGIAIARKPGEALLLWNEVKERFKDETKPSIKPDEGLLDTLADICVRAAFFRKALEIVACMEEYGMSPNKTKYSRIYVEMHSRMFSSKHASKARQDRRKEKKRAAEAFKFWLGLPNEYYASEWNFLPSSKDDDYEWSESP